MVIDSSIWALRSPMYETWGIGSLGEPRPPLGGNVLMDTYTFLLHCTWASFTARHGLERLSSLTAPAHANEYPAIQVHVKPKAPKETVQYLKAKSNIFTNYMSWHGVCQHVKLNQKDINTCPKKASILKMGLSHNFMDTIELNPI